MNRIPRLLDDFLQTDPAIRKLLARSARQNSLLQQIRALLPKPLDAHCLAAVSRDSALVLYADSSAWASRLRFFSRNLIRELQQRGHSGIESIAIRVFIPDHARKQKLRSKTLLSKENARLLRQTAESIGDPALGSALIRLSRHHR